MKKLYPIIKRLHSAGVTHWRSCLAGWFILVVAGMTSGTAHAQTPPGAPTNLTATATTTPSISLSWTQPSNDITGYNLYRCEEGATACTPAWYAWVAYAGETAPAPTTYTDTGVSSGKTYRLSLIHI